jgi:MarR family transcriptional regulator, organic hydroperoxide resistance regulator
VQKGAWGKFLNKAEKFRKTRGVFSDKAAFSPIRKKLALSVLMKFRLIINSAKRHFKWVEKQCGISGAHLWALWEIHQSPGLRVSALSAAMAFHQSTVSNLVDGLVRAKLIQRERSNSDQRVVTLSLTDAGRKLLRRAPKPARGMLAETMHHLPEELLVSLDEMLRRVLEEMRPTDKKSMKEPLSNLLTK